MFLQVIEDIMQQAANVIQVKCLGNLCQKNCLASYNMGKEIVKTLDRARELMARGRKFYNDTNIAYELPCEPVNEMPVTKTVGMDLMLKKVWDSIEDKNVGMIGLYGIGGSGKTTLMKKLNNELAKKRHDFPLVIWVVVSKDCDTDQIMEDIRQKCRIGDMNWKNKSKDEKAIEIYRVMKQKKFFLLLDDIWEELDLQSVGVPLTNEGNQSKILFTTRLENVCDQMQAKKFKVECLTEKEALDLFCMKVGEETLNSHPDIRVLAQEFIQECKGLPLALITVGRAMAGRKNPRAWRHAIKELKSFPSEVSGMEKEVFSTLKFSYDSLPTDIDKKCFLYCALFPEDRSIYVPRLIRFWIGEGFLKEHDSIQDAYNHGEDIVERLKLACLLEGEEFLWIKMHDVIQDMALWLSRNQDQDKNKILVQGEALGSSQTNLERSMMIERISIMYAKGDCWHVSVCPNLLTLIVWGNDFKIDFANVQFLSNLKVLSLRMERISTLPAAIGQLVHLEYLELSELHIKEKLPIEMKNLKSLRVFLLEYVHFSLEIIPLEVISNLERLRVFSFIESRFKEWKSSLQKMKSMLLTAMHLTHSMEKSFLEQLELLPLLEDLSITLETATGIKQLLSSTKLQRCVRLMGLYQYRTAAINTTLLPSMTSMQHLERITLVGLQDNMTESSINHIYPFRKLRWVTILDCHNLTHLTWLKYAPLLDYLIVENCSLIEQVIKEAEDNMDDMFSNLRYMSLRNLPMLRSVYKKALPFPLLQYINIMECPNLKKLPLDSNSARDRLRAIWGEKLWWDNLVWEDQAIKDQFRSKFKD